jgi:hypothetical protein
MVIENMRHLETLDALAREVQDLIVKYNSRCSGITAKNELCALRLEQNVAMTELLAKQKRALEFMLDGMVQPQMQFGEAIIDGKAAIA